MHIIGDDQLIKKIELILWKLSSIPMKIWNDIWISFKLNLVQFNLDKFNLIFKKENKVK
jgi:hypothetical protein